MRQASVPGIFILIKRPCLGGGWPGDFLGERVDAGQI